MKILITLAISLFLSLSAFANNSAEIGLKLKSIDLEGMKIVDQQTQLNTFDYDLRYTSHMPLGELKLMASAYNFNFVSSFFTSVRAYKFDKVVALIGLVYSQYQLITYFLQKGSALVVVYNVKEVENDKLIVERVLGGSKQIFEVTATQLFPSN